MSELIFDAWTVAQKELRELLATRSTSPGHLVLIAGVISILGIVLPLQAGPQWLDHAWLLSLWAWTPLFIVAAVVADSVVGERERHTLETLLASRLPDRAILLGKVAAGVIYGWGLMLITIMTSIVAINLVYARDQLLLYRPMLLVSGGLLSLLSAVLAASFGVLVSLRAASVRRAQQIITLTLLAISAIYIVVAPFVLRLLSGNWQLSFDSIFGAFDRPAIVGGVALILVGVNMVLLYVATGWFRRYRLHPD